MLEEEIKRLTVAVLDLMAVMKEMNAKPPTMFLSGGIDQGMLDRIKQGPTGSVYVDTTTNTAQANTVVPSADPDMLEDQASASMPTYTVTVDDARRALQALAAAKGKDAAKGVLEKFSATKIPDLAPQHWPEFIAACEAALS